MLQILPSTSTFKLASVHSSGEEDPANVNNFQGHNNTNKTHFLKCQHNRETFDVYTFAGVEKILINTHAYVMKLCHHYVLA